MLEQKDLQAIAQLFDERFGKMEKRFGGMEKRFEGMDERFEGMEKRFDKKLMASEVRLRHEMKELKYGLSKEMNKRIGKSTSRIVKEMDQRINRSELLMLDEMERYSNKNEREHAEIRKRLESLESIYRTTKSDSETIRAILEEMGRLEERLKVLEEKMAIA